MHQDPPYTSINQQAYCCVPACLSMILDRRGIDHGTQEEIGYALGLIVPEKDAHLFSNVRIGEAPISGYGTQVQHEEYAINRYFETHDIALQEQYVFLDEIEDVQIWLEEQINAGNDVIVCFNNKPLYGTGDWGHVSLLEGIEGKRVFLLDPEDVTPKIREVALDDLIEAIRYHGRECYGGFWVIYPGVRERRGL